MPDRSAPQAAAGLRADITRSLAFLWTEYAGKRPTAVRTDIRGDVVICTLVDAVAAFESRTHGTRQAGAAGDNGSPSLAEYKSEAVAAVVGVMRQRVTSFVSSHDRDTDVATEVFTLEPPPQRRSPDSPRNRLGTQRVLEPRA
jgi:uncharacterized protein YbcI